MSIEPRPDAQFDPALERAWHEVSDELPPERLDHAIRAAARRAVSSGPRRLTASFTRRWSLPLSIAALVVVSASLTLMVSQHDSQLPPSALDDRAARVAPQAESAPSLVEAPPAGPNEPSAARARSRGQSAPSSVAPAPATGASTAPSAAPVPAPLAVLPGTPRVSESSASAPRAADSEMPSVKPAPSTADARPPAGVGAAPRATEPLVSSAKKLESPLPAVAPPEAPRAAAETEIEVPESSASSANQVAGEHDARAALPRDTAATATPLPGRLEPRGIAPQTAQPRRKALAQPEPVQSAFELTAQPKEWIERIRELRRKGQAEQADASLRAFRSRYPDYVLPDDLQPPR